ncbi:MAG: hypothetical protein Q7T80_16600 [Methanoregula sp.]|nr:hypothetical protein [Methanoregula sp.]
MTPGPRPRKAIMEAETIAARRGPVLDVSRQRGFFCDLLLFTGPQVVFIRVGRSRTHACEPREIERQFRGVIRELRVVPQGAATCREIHLLAPWGAWQYFRISDDGIIEVRSDGTPLLQAGPGSGAGKTPGGNLS